MCGVAESAAAPGPRPTARNGARPRRALARRPASAGRPAPQRRRGTRCDGRPAFHHRPRRTRRGSRCCRRGPSGTFCRTPLSRPSLSGQLPVVHGSRSRTGFTCMIPAFRGRWDQGFGGIPRAGLYSPAVHPAKRPQPLSPSFVAEEVTRTPVRPVSPAAVAVPPTAPIISAKRTVATNTPADFINSPRTRSEECRRGSDRHGPGFLSAAPGWRAPGPVSTDGTIHQVPRHESGG